MKKIETHGITCFEPLDGSPEWYWGCDYAAGDLYEAEELYQKGGPIKNNRVLLIHYPDGEVAEPVKTLPDQYLGRPVFHEGKIINLLVDFPKGEIHVLAYEHAHRQLSTVVTLPLSGVKDCYNLLLRGDPLMLTRSGGENRFEILWPEQVSFDIGVRETFDFRDGDKLYFQEWFEDPDYREEVVVRDLHTGKILERFSGAIKEMPNGQHWLLV